MGWELAKLLLTAIIAYCAWKMGYDSGYALGRKSGIADGRAEVRAASIDPKERGPG